MKKTRSVAGRLGTGASSTNVAPTPTSSTSTSTSTSSDDLRSSSSHVNTSGSGGSEGGNEGAVLHCYLVKADERLVVLPDQKPLMLGREQVVGGFEIGDSRCSRQHLRVTFRRSEGDVLLQPMGSNPVVIQKGNNKKEHLHKGKEECLVAGDSFWLIPNTDDLEFSIDMDTPLPSARKRKRLSNETSRLSTSGDDNIKLVRAASAILPSPSAKNLEIAEDGTEEMDPELIRKALSTRTETKGKDKGKSKEVIPEDEDAVTLAFGVGGGEEDEDEEELDIPDSPKFDEEITQELESLSLSFGRVDPSPEEEEREKLPQQKKARVETAKASHPADLDDDDDEEITKLVKAAGEGDDDPTDSTSTANAPDAASSKARRQYPCKYGAACYNKNPAHRGKYSHPTGPDASASASASSSSSSSSSSVSTKSDDASDAMTSAADASAFAKPKQKAKGGKGNKSEKPESKVRGKTIVITGTLMRNRNEVTTQLKQMGAKVVGTVTKKVDIVVAGDEAGGKLQKAEALGLTVWDESELNQAIAEFEGQDDDADAAPTTSSATDSKLPKPKGELKDGEMLDFRASSGRVYQLKRCAGDIYYCVCPAWRNQNESVDRRTCKHLREFLGDAYETARIGRPASQAAPRAVIGKEAPKLLLAHKWEEDVDPTGWWISEKLDGVRAYWDGKSFISRLGNPFHAPAWFLEGLPNSMPLDGELWGGRGTFQQAVSIAKAQSSDQRWKELTFQIFDAPSINKSFEERMKVIREHLRGNKPPYARILKMYKCTDRQHLDEALKLVESQGGEGLMLRKPESKYIGGRSNTLLKVKSFHDAEAIVIGYEPGKGKHVGRTGALKLRMANGTLFKVGSGLTDKERERPPKIGSIVTYKFQELTPDGVPRFPTYVGERVDMKAPRDPDVKKLATKKGD